MKLAYLTSIESMRRWIFTKDTAPEFELEANRCVELRRPLHGLGDIDDLWLITLGKHLRKEFGLQPSMADPTLYLHTGTLNGASGSYVDDLLRAGNKERAQLCNITHEMLDIYGDEHVPFTFAGFNIDRSQGSLSIDQGFYLPRWEELPSDILFASFRSMRMTFVWLANFRPDLVFSMS